MTDRLFKTLGSDGLEVHYRQGNKVIEVDTHKAEFRGMPVHALGPYGKRKFENLVVIESNIHERIPVKFLYK
jgi:hypothetical protein